MQSSQRILLSFGYAAVGQIDELTATGAQLDVDGFEGFALELQARRLMMIGAAQVFDLRRGVLLEFIHLHKNILACKCLTAKR
ncbi:MAG: hypothetical protein ABSF22_07590 [Bryobacteraceae bacterium]